GDADPTAIVAFPPRLVEERLGDTMPAVLPQQVAGKWRVRLADRVAPPGMTLGDVLELLVEVDLEPQRVRGTDEGEVVGHRAIGRIYGFEPRREVVVVVGRGLQRGEEDGRRSQMPDVAQLGGEALEVADAVAVGVAEAAKKDLVEDLWLRLRLWLRNRRGLRLRGGDRPADRGRQQCQRPE